MTRQFNFKLASVLFNGKWYTGEEWEEYQKQLKAKQATTPTVNKYPNFKATIKDKTPAVDIYEISGTDGMTDKEIINACDPNNFGGMVYGNICKVYID